jgi:hypothetical protein
VFGVLEKVKLELGLFYVISRRINLLPVNVPKHFLKSLKFSA